MSAKAERRERKRARRDDGWAREEREVMLARARLLVVCDKCGLVQPHRFDYFKEDDPYFVASCVGALGLSCDSKFCTPADYYL